MLAAVAAPLALLITATSAAAESEGALMCFGSDAPEPSVGNDTRAETTQRAGNTWDDWVWRGPTFLCPNNVPSCSYAWGQSKTAGWAWNVGLSLAVANNPMTWLASVTPNYGRNGSTTTSFTWSIVMLPGQYAQPISVVRRRWEGGRFVGAYVRAPSLDGQCKGQYPQKMMQWQGGYRWGSWSQNARDFDFGSYNVWR
jgi:hypothetical protein